MAAACFQGWALCLRGDYRRAEIQVESAIRLAERIGHPGSLAMALMYAAALYRQPGHAPGHHAPAERAFELTGTPDLHLVAGGRRAGVLGWQRALAGDRDGLAQIEAAQEELAEATGRGPYQRPAPRWWLVDARMALGRFRPGRGLPRPVR